MIAIVWEFLVKEESVAAFRRIYGPDGDWAALFREYSGYAGTTLLQDEAKATRFFTVDRWSHAAAFQQMRDASRAEYARLDEECRSLTSLERELGIFEVV